MENNKNKKSVKFQGDMLNFCDFIQVFVFTRNHHLNTHICIQYLFGCKTEICSFQNNPKDLDLSCKIYLDLLKVITCIIANYIGLIDICSHLREGKPRLIAE